jgi:PAS domain S-box-containing protein
VLSANIGTFDWNINTGELKWSDRCKAVFGLPRDASISYEIFLSRLHQEDRDRVHEIVQQVLDPAGEGSYDAEYRTIWPDGSIHWIVARGRCFFEGKGDTRKAARFIGTALDITDMKEAELRVARAKEQAEAANRAKDRFLAALSHELRTPLTPVLLTAAAREHDPEISEDLRADMALIRRNVELEARLIDDLLDLTRISRGKLKLNVRPIDPMRAIHAAIGVCEDEIQGKGLRLTIQGPSQQALVRGDTARLQQIFWNLIKNAVKFTSAEGRIEIRCDVQPDQNRFVARVSDNGIGIEPDVLPRIFDAFEQGDDKTAKEFGGLGLGLAICRVLVDMHGGHLTADSQGKNRGATFTVELPLAPQPDASSFVPTIAARIAALQDHSHPVVTGSPSGADSAQQKSLRILLVEDHDATSRVVAMLLRQLSHQVTAAPTVADALRHVEESKFDLLISDLGLPDGTGLELMRQIRSKYGLTGICLSGYGMDRDLLESREAGFVEHLIKPVDLPRLRSAIESAVS